jgi:peptide/nickel transport system substrate-binding protein
MDVQQNVEWEKMKKQRKKGGRVMKKRTLTWFAILACMTFFMALGVNAAGAATTLVVARGADANSLDPPESQSFEAIKCADWSFDGLVRFKGNTHEIAPALATSWELSDDGLMWTFKLREGVKFHDGTTFNADAVVFSFERQRDKQNPYYSKYFARWRAKFGNVKLTEKVDAHTVRIHLNKPQPTLLANLAFYIGYIVSPTAVMKDKDGFRENPVGTGYFKFVRWIKDDIIEYEANTDYWDGPPKFDRLIVKVIPDNEVRLLALKKGEVHVAYGIPYAHFGEMEKSEDMKIYSTTTLGVAWVALNNEEKPFDNPKVRKAVRMAINRDRLFQIVFYGLGKPAKQIMPPSWWGHNANIPEPEYNPDKAKSLLAEAGYPNGFKTDLISWTNPRPYNPSPRDTVALIKSDLKKIGVDVEIKMMRWNTFRESRGKGGYGMTLAGWISSTLDPDGIIYPLFHSSYIRKIDAINWARWRNARSDQLLVEARSIYDQEKRDGLYQQVAQEIDNDDVAVFIAHPVAAIGARSNVKNIFIHDSHWVPLNQVYLE